MTYDEWVASVPGCIKSDPLWSFQVYPKALFLADLAWSDCELMMKEPRGRAIAEQLVRSTGSIAANLEEGFGRGFGKDYAYFQRIALGSARETRGWYYRGRRLLSEEVLNHRLALVTDIIAMLVSTSAYQRNRKPTR
jgi:four helix bundle protein